MPEKEDNTWQLVSRYLSLAFLIPVSTFVGYAIGYLLDKAFHTTFLKLVCLLIGIAAGFLEFFRELQKDTRQQ
jgi:F0F1-type ATP synthase assembly protein I